MARVLTVWLNVVFLLFLLTVLVIAFRASTPEQRARFSQTGLTAIRRVKEAATRRRPDLAAFQDALRARTQWTVVTPALVALNAATFVLMLFGTGAFSDPQTLVAWGANFGPRTTNGEWWRLVTTMFVHSGMVHLLVNLAGLVQVGLILERLVGPLAFAAAYIAAGVFASLVSLFAYPIGVSVGASGAIFGIYGLLLASFVWSLQHRSATTIPLRAWTRLLPAAAVFILYSLETDNLPGAAELAGLVVGFISGVALQIRLSDGKPPVWRAAAAMGTTLVIAIACAVPLRGVADVRPELEHVVAVEHHLASTYQTAVDRLRKDRMTAEAVAQLIDRTIVPELQAAHARLKAIEGVPSEHQPLVAGAEEYFRLRDQSWRLRAQGLRRTNMLKLREAEAAERASLEALQVVTKQLDHP